MVSNFLTVFQPVLCGFRSVVWEAEMAVGVQDYDPANLGSRSLFQRLILPSFVCHLWGNLSHWDHMLFGGRLTSPLNLC